MARPRRWPVVNKIHWDKRQGFIKKGIDEGATLVTGGLGRPEGLHKGYDVWPAAFADVTNDMTIVREEVFRAGVVDHRL